MSDYRARTNAFLGRTVGPTEKGDEVVTEVLDKAEAYRADAEAYRALMADDRHQIRFNEADFVIQHPAKERVLGDLFECDLHEVASRMGTPPEEAIGGTFYCAVNGDEIVIEEQVHG